MADKTVMIAAGVGAALALFWLMGRARADDGDETSIAEDLGRGAVEVAKDVVKGAGKATVETGVGAVKGAAGAVAEVGKAIHDAIFPLDKCAKAMRENSVVGVSWNCNPETFAEWLVSGRPTACYALEDGRISCSKGWSSGGASGTW